MFCYILTMRRSYKLNSLKSAKKKEGFFRSAKEQIRKNKGTFIVYTVLRIFVIFSLISAAIRNEYEHVFVCVLSLVLFVMPAVIEKKLKIDFPSTLEVIMLLFIFSAEILGEIHNFYMLVPYWDTVLHTLNGFLFAAFGFALLDIINRNENIKFQLSPIYLAIVAFCFSMTIGVLWEFFEFSCDVFLGTDMQKDFVINSFSSVTLDPAMSNTPIPVENITSVFINGDDLGLGGYLDIGLIDTMKDLLVNFLGAVIFCVIGFFYVKNRGKGNFAKRFIPVLDKNNK